MKKLIVCEMLCLLFLHSFATVIAFKITHLSTFLGKKEVIVVRCVLVPDLHERGLYKDWLRCTLIHPHCFGQNIQINGLSTVQYIPLFKKKRMLYRGPLTFILSCQRELHYDSSIPLMLSISAIALVASGKNTVQTKTLRCRKKATTSW